MARLTHTGKKKYIDVLDKLVESYNLTKSSTTGFAPADVNKNNEDIVWKNLFHKYVATPQTPPIYKVGTSVRLVINKGIFQKSSTPNYLDEMFYISKANINHKPITYQ